MIAQLLISTSVVLSAGPENWERFRGPNGTATVEDPRIPTVIGPDKNVVWKVPLSGVGNSSPVLWGQQLFLHSSTKDGTSRSLLCLDAATGKTLWERPVPGSHVAIRADSSFASSTPATDGQAVYVSFWDGKDILLTAFDFQGKKLWNKNLGEFNSQHGPGASPILYKDTVFLANDMDKDDFTTKKLNERPSFLMAFHKRTGDLLWEKARLTERTCYSAPFFRSVPGGNVPELIVTNTKAVSAYDPETGSLLWEMKGWQDKGVKSPLRTVASPALLGDTLCVTSGGDAGRYAIGLTLPTAGKRENPEIAWDNRKDFPYVSSPLARGQHFYFMNDKGYAGCYEARSGKQVWLERISETGFHSSPLLINGKIYAFSIAGDCFLLAAEPTYQLLAQHELGETIRATPAAAGGRLYVRGDRHLYCFGQVP